MYPDRDHQIAHLYEDDKKLTSAIISVLPDLQNYVTPEGKPYMDVFNLGNCGALRLRKCLFVKDIFQHLLIHVYFGKK